MFITKKKGFRFYLPEGVFLSTTCNDAMYLMKIKGVSEMPDFIQVRDDHFTLIGYHRADRPQMIAPLMGELVSVTELRTLIEGLPYGILKKINT